MIEQKDIKVERTEQEYSISSSQFKVTYPDGTVGFVWSPVWHDMSYPEEELAAFEYASKLFREGKHKDGK